MLKLRYYGDPILRRRATEVRAFDDALRTVADEMLEAMTREEGVGLAAPQVGLDMRVLVALAMREPGDEDAEPIVVINPEITERSHETWVYEEGCLSIPGIRGDVTRPERIVMRYRDVNGDEKTLEAIGMFARILQHEVDHLDGKLFIDYLSTAEKMLLKPKLRKIARLNDE
ncbi:MAG TPA: peptide deformylase [Candidatus Krumholzibacteria bacterium]|nr:peptide deformylase [Candidatus Krumholzibacteria bacterium]